MKKHHNKFIMSATWKDQDSEYITPDMRKVGVGMSLPWSTTIDEKRWLVATDGHRAHFVRWDDDFTPDEAHVMLMSRGPTRKNLGVRPPDIKATLPSRALYSILVPVPDVLALVHGATRMSKAALHLPSSGEPIVVAQNYAKVAQPQAVYLERSFIRDAMYMADAKQKVVEKANRKIEQENENLVAEEKKAPLQPTLIWFEWAGPLEPVRISVNGDEDAFAIVMPRRLDF